MHTNIDKFPPIDITNSEAPVFASLFPHQSIAALPVAAADTLRAIFTQLKPGEDPAPVALVLGWDAVRPTLDVVGIDPRYLNDGKSKEMLALGFRDMILKRRAMDQETYAVAFINAAWFKAFKPSDIHLIRTADDNGLQGEAEKLEVVLVDTIWQDGQRILISQVERSETGAPKLQEPWRDMSAGATAVRNRFWHTIAPALCAPSYADAVLAAFEGEKDMDGGAQ